jgi:type IV pilus assembly protein PilC
MPVYTYHALDKQGERLLGQMPAPNEAGLEQKLKQNEVWLLEARLHTAASPLSRGAHARLGWGRGAVRRRDLIEFCTLMSFQAKVGVPLLQALEVVQQDCQNAALRQVLDGLQEHIEAGLLFHEALGQYPKLFTPHFVSVIRAGETSSKLPEAFTDLRNYLEWVERVAADVRQASLYPGIVLSVVSVFVTGLFIFIVPRFAALLKAANAPLPPLTQLVFRMSDFLKVSWWVWLLLAPSLIAGLLLVRRHSKRVAFWWDQAKLKLPVFGGLNWMLAISRFTHNLAILYRSGVPILQALKLCQGVIGNVVVEQAVAELEEAVKAGSTISEGLRRDPIFPPILLRMVIMGETTGNLDHALENVSEYFNEVIPRRIKKVLTIFEPALTVLLIAVVALVALSIYLPILSLIGAIRS